MPLNALYHFFVSNNLSTFQVSTLLPQKISPYNAAPDSSPLVLTIAFFFEVVSRSSPHVIVSLRLYNFISFSGLTPRANILLRYGFLRFTIGATPSLATGTTHIPSVCSSSVRGLEIIANWFFLACRSSIPSPVPPFVTIILTEGCIFIKSLHHFITNG